MYLCQELCAKTLRELAEYFQLGHVGSVSYVTHQVREMKRTDKGFERKVDRLIKSIIVQVT